MAAVLLLLVPVLTGGDHFNMFRFYQPVYPVICLTGMLLLGKSGLLDAKTGDPCPREAQRHVFGLLVVVLVCAYWLFAYGHNLSWSAIRWGKPIYHEFHIAESGLKTGAHLNRLFERQDSLPSVGVVTAGAVARVYSGETIDLMGLNSVQMAHAAGDREGMKNHAAFEKSVFWELRPDVLLACPPTPPKTENRFTIWLKDLFDEPEFIENWSYGCLTLDVDPPASHTGFFKKSYVEKTVAIPGYRFCELMVWSNGWIHVTAADHTEPSVR